MLLAARLTARLDGWHAIVLAPIVTTSLVGVVTAPVQAVTFGTLTPASVPANLVAAPLAPLATASAAVTAALSPVPAMSDLAGAGAWMVGSTMLGIARFAAALPFARLQLPPLADDLLLVLYLVLGASVVALLPEGRWLARRVEHWCTTEPRAAWSAAGGFAFVLLAALVIV